MKKTFLYLSCLFLALFSASCHKTKTCACYVNWGNEVIDSAAWNAAGQPFYMCKSGQPIPPKTVFWDTLVQSNYNCASLDYYDSVGFEYPEEGLRIHPMRECFEK